MSERQISTGEAAKISGLTIRTLQHYDNIGVLPASGRTEGGRRYYTEKDMVRLEHIVFYRGLGFSLDVIKEKMKSNEFEDSANELLDKQKILLYNQIHNIQNSIAAIEASQEIIRDGKEPPWMALSTFMQSLGTVDLSSWGDYEFSTEQQEIFAQDFQSIDEVLEFYNTWTKLSIKAAAFYDAGIEADTSLAQELAADWIEMANKVSKGNEEHLEAYLQVDEKREVWNPPERELMGKAELLLDEAVRIYQNKQKQSK